MSTWRILSNGPSIEQLAELPGEGPIVAVNHAILHREIQADYWCVQEYSRQIENMLVNVAHGPRYETWVGRGHASKWYGRLQYRKLHGLPPLRICSHPQDTSHWVSILVKHGFGHGTKVHWGTFTFSCAVANCLIRGATEIRCFGVDLDGDTNFGGGPTSACIRASFARAKGKAWGNSADRWVWERQELENIIQECEENGVTVTRQDTGAALAALAESRAR